MHFSKYILLCSYALLFFSNCVSEFETPSQGYENLLVVEAFLSNDDGPFEVRLSRSFPIDTSAFIAESGAEVSISEESGERYVLSSDPNSGIYYSNTIRGETGKTYQLHIRTRTGQEYESEKVTLRETPEIDSVNFNYEERSTAGLVGIQIYVNTHDPNNNTWYYRWEWDETWEFYSATPSTHVYENGEIFVREDNIYRCWKHHESSSILIATSKNLSQDVISQFPVNYVSSQTDRLRSQYSINVRQYALSEESYNYWIELQKVTETLGTLFDPQPATVFSNIRNVNNDTEVVLGYFDASSVKEKRIFVTRADFPFIRVPNYYAMCEDSIVSRGMLEEMMQNGYMLASEEVSDFGTLVYRMSDPWCVDCRFAGTNEKPDFWP